MLTCIIALALARIEQTDRSAEVVSRDPALAQLVSQFFHAQQAKGREKLIPEIERGAQWSIERVAHEVREAALWAHIAGADRIVVPTQSAGDVGVVFRGFKDPDQSKARGMVLCMPSGEGLGEANLALNLAIQTLGPEFCNDSYIVAMDKAVGGGFHQHPAAGDDLRKIVLEVRRHLHVDTDRVFLFGYADGGAAAWTTALFHADLFAGAIIVASHPRLPYAEQLAPLLLPNLRALPVLSIYAGETDEAVPTAIYNRSVAQFGERNSLPLRGLETAFSSTEQGHLPDYSKIESAIRDFAGRRRAAFGQKTGRWFRYLSQGDLGWVKAVKLHGEPWTDEQLSIVVGPSDRDAYITDFFKDKLFYLGGEANGQTIALESKGVSQVELLLYEGMIDFTKPVTVTVNGRKRHEAVIQPSIATLLSAAYDEWDFQRLVYARLTFSVARD